MGKPDPKVRLRTASSKTRRSAAPKSAGSGLTKAGPAGIEVSAQVKAEAAAIDVDPVVLAIWRLDAEPVQRTPARRGSRAAEPVREPLAGLKVER